MLVSFGLTLLVLFALSAERWHLHREVRAIALRIHVNGTRGKSSVTRYVAAALRANGSIVCAKVTGEKPMWIGADGAEKPLQRRGPARIQEQFRCIRRAAREGADTLVLECMSIQPEYQRLESRFLRPHLYILTNIRDDHREVLGDDQATQRAFFISAIPPEARLICSGDTARQLYAQKRLDNDVIIHSSSPENLDWPGYMQENIGLALTVCEAAGVRKEDALPAILAEARRHALSPLRLTAGGKTIHFVNGFPVNDVESAETFVHYWHTRMAAPPLYILFNARADRPLRSRAFAPWLCAHREMEGVIVTGTHAAAMRRMLVKNGCDPARIHVLPHRLCRDVDQYLMGMCPPQALVLGLGNIGGEGYTLLQCLSEGAAGGDGHVD